MKTRVGWSMVVLSFPVWTAAFVVPWFPMENTTRAAVVTACLVAGEVLFWVGGVLVGAQLMRRLKPPRVDTGKSMAGKHVAVVGSNGGLGSAVVAALRREGARVTLLARSAPAVDITVDLASPPDVERAAMELSSVDHVVVAAGHDTRKPLAQTTDLEMVSDVAVNLLGPMQFARAALPRLNAHGSILFLGGFADGHLALPFHAVDAATRSALATFCQGVNREQAALGNTTRLQWFCPAPADTPAELPYAALWKRVGIKPVSTEVVANAVLTALVSGRPVSIMGFTTRVGAIINAVMPEAADLLFMDAMSRTMKEHFAAAGEQGTA